MIRQELETVSETAYQRFVQKLHPGVPDILGVRLPILHRFAKRLAREKGLSVLAQIAPASLEERLLYGMIIGYAKTGDRWAALPEFINRINAWGVCDGAVAVCKFLGDDKHRTLAFLEPYIDSEKAYDQRFVAVVLKTYFLTPDWWETSVAVYERLTHSDYYVRMAVAWGLAEWATVKPDEVLAVLSRFHPDIQTKAKRKMCESFRVAPEIKKRLRDNAAGNHG